MASCCLLQGRRVEMQTGRFLKNIELSLPDYFGMTSKEIIIFVLTALRISNLMY
jgi:hypothetical protein